ncbi:MAG: glycosyltransferase family 2 protein [Alphaproteobacteria bacterium]|nr:glycosyltransferase family 2 protein [Alphaproteobacteria bacterium]
MPDRPTISAILITRDERDNIADCLAALSFCDEIVVVDSGSADGTPDIAREHGAKVSIEADWQGYGVQKQRALDRAGSDWVLAVDADERIPEALRDEILVAVAAAGFAGYRIKRLNWFLGRPLRHGGWYPDPVLRLARRDAARYKPAIVHETLLVDGRVGDLEAPMEHLSYRTIDDVLAKMRRYALASAEARRRDGAAGGLGSALLRAKFTFLKTYFLQLGLLDGGRGLVAAIARSQETFWRYLAAGWEDKQ